MSIIINHIKLSKGIVRLHSQCNHRGPWHRTTMARSSLPSRHNRITIDSP